jgi:hypothetical protein
VANAPTIRSITCASPAMLNDPRIRRRAGSTFRLAKSKWLTYAEINEDMLTLPIPPPTSISRCPSTSPMAFFVIRGALAFVLIRKGGEGRAKNNKNMSGILAKKVGHLGGCEGRGQDVLVLEDLYPFLEVAVEYKRGFGVVLQFVLHIHCRGGCGRW